MKWSTLHRRRKRQILRTQKLRASLLDRLARRLAFDLIETKVKITDVRHAFVNDDWVRNMATLRLTTNYVNKQGSRFVVHLPVSGDLVEDKRDEQLGLIFANHVLYMLAAFIVTHRLEPVVNRYRQRLNRLSIRQLIGRIHESEHQLVRTTR